MVEVQNHVASNLLQTLEFIGKLSWDGWGIFSLDEDARKMRRKRPFEGAW